MNATGVRSCWQWSSFLNRCVIPRRNFNGRRSHNHCILLWRNVNYSHNINKGTSRRPLLLSIVPRRTKCDTIKSTFTTTTKKYPAHKILSTTTPTTTVVAATAAAGQDPGVTAAVLPGWMVRHPTTVACVPVLGNLAYASLAGGFLCSDVLSLRILLICGYSGLVTYHALRPTPLLIPLRWSGFFVVVNLVMATMLIVEQLPPSFTDEEEELHVQHFAPLSLTSFRALMDIGTRRTYNDGDVLTVANQPCDTLFFIVSGKASMTNASGKHISKLQRGAFPNCMSFQRAGWDSTRRHSSSSSSSGIHNNDTSSSDSDSNSNNNNNNNVAYGTIRCEGDVECIVWDGEDLQTLLETYNDDDDMILRMDHVVIEAVIRRLLVDSEGANVTDYIRVISQGWAHENVQQRKIKSMTTKRKKDQEK